MLRLGEAHRNHLMRPGAQGVRVLGRVTDVDLRGPNLGSELLNPLLQGASEERLWRFGHTALEQVLEDGSLLGFGQPLNRLEQQTRDLAPLAARFR